MPQNAGINISGLDSLINKIDEMEEGIRVGVDAEMTASADTIAREAASNAAAIDDAGRIRGAIKANVTAPYKKYVTVNAFDAAYVEFGTGPFAARYVPKLPEEVQKYAKTFYVNGLGTTPEQPYLVPAALKEFPALVERIKKLLQP